MTFSLFGYGSLIFSPELADDVSELVPARLPGYRRRFNKLSDTRHCPREESHDAFPPPDARFLSDERHASLVLGLEQAEGAGVDGMLLVYPRALRAEVLAVTDRREGHDPTLPVAQLGYLREERVAVRRDTGAEVPCTVYLTNPHPDCPYAMGHLTLRECARAMVNATPRLRAGDSDSRGLFYLEGVRESLRAVGIVDPDLELLAAELRALDGPWTEHVAEVQR